MQRGSDPDAPYQPAVQSGWLPVQTNYFYYHLPAASPLPGGSVDTTDGFMARPTTSGYVWRVHIPEDGLYRVTLRGLITLDRTTTYRTLILLKGTATDYNPGNHRYTFASTAPSRTSAIHYAGSLEAVVAARAGEVIYSAAGAGLEYHLGDDTRPQLSSLTVRWIGRYP
jgi:hypothetical protein